MRRSVRLIAEEIHRYAVAHPRARDTVDGIVWWLHMQREEDIRSNVADAVAWLVQQGVLVQYHLPDGSSAFGRDLSQSEEEAG